MTESESYRVYQLKRETPRSTRIRYETELNEAQCRAVLSPGGPALVIAGAGTGKTRTLTYRVARLVESGVPADRIVLLTFTRRAAQEMLARVAALTGGECKEIAGGTFHAFASWLLRRHPPDGFPNRFTILDRGDAEDTLQLVRGERGRIRGERRFPKKRTIYDMISKAINQDRPIERVIADEYESFAAHTEAIIEIRDAYDAFKRKHALMDYDDLLLHLAQRLAADDGRELCARFQHVLVDEYQDTNRLQAEIADRLASGHRNLMAVGDDAQSIYAFRGADYRNILGFVERHADAEVIKLEQNYRSTQEILDVANAVISAAGVGFQKRLFTSREGERPAVVMTSSEQDQAAFIAQRVIELREEGTPLQHNAVLFRSSFQSYELELELGRRDIPFVKYGGFRFLEAAHVKDVLAHLRVVENPLDAVSWTRLLCLVPGIGPRWANDLIARARERGDFYSLSTQPAPRAAVKPLRALDRLFEHLLAGTEEEVAPAAHVAAVVAHLRPGFAERYDDPARRVRDLEHFQVLAEGYASLPALLADASLDPPDRAIENGLGSPLDEGERLVLSTIHSAKGMEWRHVFLLGALDGYFPSMWSARDPEALEEERRLMYVATTRAKDLLYVTYPVGVLHPSSGRILSQPTRFLDDVPTAAIERWAVRG